MTFSRCKFISVAVFFCLGKIADRQFCVFEVVHFPTDKQKYIIIIAMFKVSFFLVLLINL